MGIFLPGASMKFTRLAHAASLALLLHVGSVAASPLMDLRAEDLLPMAPQLRSSLVLNANQQLLWQQSEARTRSVLRERQARREGLQKQASALATRDNAELRDLGSAAETEAAASALEDAQLRGLWLTMNDALDDGQRRTVLRFLADQLERVRDDGPPAREGGGAGREGGRGGPGGGRGRGGGAGGGSP
jgi:hypothetical protein